MLKGTTYRKLGVRMYEGPRINEKVIGEIGAGIIKNFRKKKEA
jgi:hypothetical protein